MQTLEISFNSHEAIKMLAKQLNTEAETDCFEKVLKLPESYGQGRIMGFQFGEGIDLLLFNCTLKKDLIFVLNEKETPALQFNLSAKGGVRHHYNDKQIQYSLNPLQGTITADVLEGKHAYQFPSNREIVFACLLIDRKRYKEKINCLIEKMPEKLETVFSDTAAKQTFFYQGNYSITSSECLQAILADTQTGIVRSTYLEGVALELLSYQIKQFRDDLHPTSKQVTLRKQDVEKIFDARDILLKNLRESPTIENLAKKVGINQTKLKMGFKKIFDKPVKTWLRDKRLEMAKLLLLEGELSVRMVAETVGYTNQSHFSNRFKQKYGMLPKDFVQSVKVRLSELK